MRSIVYNRTGASDVLHQVEQDVPEPGPDEVRVRIAVSGVNPTDWKRRAALTGPTELAERIVPNQDGAGVIDAVGDGVDTLSVGDRVWILLAQHESTNGTAQEYVVMAAWKAVKLPESVSFDVGASLGVPAMTAHRALTIHEDGPSRLHPGALAGRTVLVSGGAGAVGHAAIQLARWAGATVVTTVSSPYKAELATAAGAHHTVDYTRGDAAESIRGFAPGGVDMVVEVDAVGNVDLLTRVLAERGSIAAYANSAAGMSIPIRSFMTLNARLQFVLLYTAGDAAIAAGIEDVSAAAAVGALEVGAAHGLPLTRYPLEQTAAAHDAVEAHAIGKVLIDVASL